MNPIELLPVQGWEKHASCRRVDPELFFSTKLADQELAKMVCRGCPVQPQCLAWALETGQDHGILGGLDESERRAKHGRWKRPPEGARHTTRAQQIAADPDRLLAFLAQGLTPAQIAREYNTNAGSINEATAIVKRQAPAVYAAATTGLETTS